MLTEGDQEHVVIILMVYILLFQCGCGYNLHFSICLVRRTQILNLCNVFILFKLERKTPVLFLSKGYGMGS